MRKYSSLIVSGFAVSGIIGAVLRYIHVSTCYDDLGLPIPGMPVTTILTVFSVIIAVAALILTSLLNSKSAPMPGYNGAFSTSKGGTGLLAQILSAILIAVSSVMRFQNGFYTNVNYSIVITVLGILSAIAVIFSAVYAYKGSQKKIIGYLSIITSVFLCMHLMYIFSLNLSNPILLTYSFDCVAIGSASLYIFAAGGYALNKVQTFSTLFTGFISIAFSIIAITGQQSDASDVLMYISIVLMVCPGMSAFLKNLHKKIIYKLLKAVSKRCSLY